jgi:hypothetical protein
MHCHHFLACHSRLASLERVHAMLLQLASVLMSGVFIYRYILRAELPHQHPQPPGSSHGLDLSAATLQGLGRRQQ